MRKLLTIMALFLIITNAYALERIIDPEIPVEEDFLDFEQNLPDLLESTFMVAILSFSTMAVGLFFVILFFVGIKIGVDGILS
jgi:hypothetical protein